MDWYWYVLIAGTSLLVLAVAGAVFLLRPSVHDERDPEGDY